MRFRRIASRWLARLRSPSSCRAAAAASHAGQFDRQRRVQRGQRRQRARSSAAGAAAAPELGRRAPSAARRGPADSQVLTNAKDGKLIVGIKFDQPGLGLKNPDGTFSGFDVEVAKYVANKLGVEPSRHRVQGGQVRRARGPDRARRGRLHRRHLLDHRHPQGEGQLRRAVLHRRIRTCWSRPTTPTSPDRRRWPARSCAR